MFYKFTPEELNMLCDLLITRAGKIISKPCKYEHYYVSSCQAFLYFVKRDRVRVEKRLSLVLNTSIQKYISYCGDKSSINVPALISCALLGDFSLGVKDIGVFRGKVVSFGNAVLMNCLTTRSVFFLGYGYKYQENLRERISYIKSGFLSKAPVGYEELGISYNQYVPNLHLYNVNDLVSVLYSGKLSNHSLTSDVMLKLEKSGVLFGSLKNGLCFKGTKASKSRLVLSGSNGLFSLPYPMNFVCDAFSISLSDYIGYSDSVAELSDYVINNLGKILSNTDYLPYLDSYLFIIEKFYKENVPYNDLNKLCGYTVDYAVIERLRKFNKCLNRYYTVSCPVNLKPWAMPSVSVADVVSENITVTESESVSESISEAEKIANEREAYYNSHKEYLRQLRVAEQERADYISDFISRLRGLGSAIDVDFVLREFHNCNASLYKKSPILRGTRTKLCDSTLTMTDCKLLEPFLSCTEYNFDDLLLEVKGCNGLIDDKESVYFGFLSLLLRSGLVKKEWLSGLNHRWVFNNDSALLLNPACNFIYSDYVKLYDYSVSASYTGILDKFSQSLNSVLQSRFGEIACGLRGSYSDSCSVSIKISGFYNWVFEICHYLISLGFNSVNAIGFYLMCGMDSYFSKLSEFELEVLKETLCELGLYKEPKDN